MMAATNGTRYLFVLSSLKQSCRCVVGTHGISLSLLTCDCFSVRGQDQRGQLSQETVRDFVDIV